MMIYIYRKLKQICYLSAYRKKKDGVKTNKRQTILTSRENKLMTESKIEYLRLLNNIYLPIKAFLVWAVVIKPLKKDKNDILHDR